MTVYRQQAYFWIHRLWGRGSHNGYRLRPLNTVVDNILYDHLFIYFKNNKFFKTLFAEKNAFISPPQTMHL